MSVRVDSHQNVYVSDRENNRIQIFDSNGKFLRQWTHLGATQGMDISPKDELWIITHRNNQENLAYDTLAGRIMHVDIATGKILGSMESPGHWLSLGQNGDIFIGSLTGNIFRWYPGWVEGMSETAPGVVKNRRKTTERFMNIKRFVLPAAVGTMLCLVSAQAQTMAPPITKPLKLYNTAKQKLLEGKQVFSFTQDKMDPAAYCEAAKHYDYTWFEMQHSTLEFADIEKMIATCPHAAAIPMIRLPDAQEWHIQHATDIGCLGVIVPTVDDVDRARAGRPVGALSTVRKAQFGRRPVSRPFGASTGSTTGTPSMKTCWWSS